MNESGKESRRGECPVCGLPIPFLKTQWALGKPFECKLCASKIVVPKAKQMAAFGLYIAGTAVARSLGFLITLLLFALGMLLSWPLATVRLVDEGKKP